MKGGLGIPRTTLTAQTRLFRKYPRYFSITASSSKPLLVLGIEISCDDTCVSLLSRSSQSSASILHNAKTVSDNTEFGGVVPVVALASHTSGLAPLIDGALKELPAWKLDHHHDKHTRGSHDGIIIDGVLRIKPDVIAVTRGPGMMANLAVGLNTAKGLAMAMQRPMVGVNHMQAHALTPRLVSALEGSASGSSSSEEAALKAGREEEAAAPLVPPGPPADSEYPYLTLLVSGGHTQLSLSVSPISHPILASVSFLALGRALDHSARLILPPELVTAHKDVMYARLLESFAFPYSTDEENYGWYEPSRTRADEIRPSETGERWGWTLPVPLADTRRMAYSFSGLRGDLTKIVRGLKESSPVGMAFRTEDQEEERRTMARELMRLCFEHLAGRIMFVLAGDADVTLAGLARTKATATPAQGRDIRTVVVSGGVASNRFLLHVLRRMLDVRGFENVRVVAPPPWLCTDNAAMIAWTGADMWEEGYRSAMDVRPLKKWSVDPRAEDGGILGVDGWFKADQ